MAHLYRIPAAVLLTLASLSAARGEILYRIIPAADRTKVTIEMTIDANGKSFDLQMPSWSPGLYAKEDYWKTMGEVSARSTGATLRVTHPRGDTWHVEAAGKQIVRVSYDRPVIGGRERLGMFSSDDQTIHFSGPATYLYVIGRKEEPVFLFFNLPAGWKVAVGLNAARKPGLMGGFPPNTFVAKNYDVLVDNSVTMGQFDEFHYTAAGKDHELAIRGDARDKLDKKKAVKMAKFISDSETKFFGGAPYDRYVWQIWAREGKDGAGGVEHGSSTQIFLATGEGPRALRGMAHEFFHLWNVKRIRSRALGPFDYTKLPQTGALWWLEGVTDYYAELLPFRNGAGTEKDFLMAAAGNLTAVRKNPARFEISPYDASYRVGEETDGMSGGYKVSYYPTGWVLGMMFDIELRSRTNGKYSLDDVEHALWNLCKGDKPGFAEDEIRKQLIHFGGAAMGPLYDTWVMKPGELPVETELAKVGLLTMTHLGGPTKGQISFAPLRKTSSEQDALRAHWLYGKTGGAPELIDWL